MSSCASADAGVSGSGRATSTSPQHSRVEETLADDETAALCVDLFLGEAELAQDLRVVLAEGRRREAVARVLFEELLRRYEYPKLELAGEVARMRATMVSGVKRMPVRFGIGA
jgi:hypothetical protein